MTALRQFRLPDIGEGLTDAEILAWRVQAGDTVEVNQPIVEIETAKVVVELPCPYAGTVVEVLAAEGATVEVGVPIITVAVAEDVPAVPAAPEPPEHTPVLVGYGVSPAAPSRRRPKVAVHHQNGRGGDPRAAARPASAHGPVPATPPARKLARDLGVDLADVVGTGRDGVITRDDIRQAATAPPADRDGGRTGGQDSGQGREERIPVRGVRKHTAAAMVSSAFTAPHVTAWLQTDVTAAAEAVARLRRLPEFAGVKVSPLLLVAKALLLAVRRHPAINSTWDGPAQEIVVKHHVHLGIAAATSRGLLVPTVRDAHRLSLAELARAIEQATATARDGRASPQDLAGGTITITNVGIFGVDGGTPILTPGQAGILSLGQIRDMAWVHEGELAVRKVTTLALSFDHRIVDGELAAAVLRDMAAMLADPLLLLAWS